MSDKVETVHLVFGITGHGVISTYCKAALQQTDTGWTSDVNYWGRVGIKTHKPWTSITVAPELVTCKQCAKLKREETQV